MSVDEDGDELIGPREELCLVLLVVRSVVTAFNVEWCALELPDIVVATILRIRSHE